VTVQPILAQARDTGSLLLATRAKHVHHESRSATALQQDQIRTVYIVVNPEKLQHLPKERTA
jgi:hypothetical protein